MGLTAHNLKRRQQAAEGHTNEVLKARAHLAAAQAEVERLQLELNTASAHLATCQAVHGVFVVPADEKPVKAAKKKAKKKATSKKGK